MYADTVAAVIDPLDELMEWLYKELHQVFDDIYFWVFMQFDGLKLWFYFDTAVPVADELRTLVYASYAVVVVVGGLVAMTHESLQSRYSFKEIAPRLAIGLGLAWVSQYLVYWVWTGERTVVEALLEFPDKANHDAFAMFPHKEPLDAFDALLSIVGDPVNGTKTLLAILQVVLVVVAMLVLLWTQVTRAIAWFGVVMVAPVALACHGLPFTEGVSRLWWRVLAACAGSSIGQAACVWVWVRIAFDSDGRAQGAGDDTAALGMDFLVSVIAVWAMWKVHAAAFTWARGRPVRVPGARMVAGAVAWRTMNRLGGGRRRRSTGPMPRDPRPSRSSGPPPLAGRPEPAPQLPPSGWNDGWDPNPPHRGLSPQRGWRPRIDHAAVRRAAQRRGRQPRPQIRSNPLTLTVPPPASGDEARDAGVRYERPPILVRPRSGAVPTPSPTGQRGSRPPRTHPVPAQATPGLPQRSTPTPEPKQSALRTAMAPYTARQRQQQPPRRKGGE